MKSKQLAKVLTVGVRKTREFVVWTLVQGEIEIIVKTQFG